MRNESAFENGLRLITKPKQLLIEDERGEKIFEKLNEILNINDIQIQPYKGKDKLNKFLKALIARKPEFEMVESIGIIRDADGFPDRAFQSVTRALKNAELPIPNKPLEKTDTRPSISVYLMPDGENTIGMLEDLFIKSIPPKPIYDECLNGFIACAGNYLGLKFNAKSIAYAYITLQDRVDIHLGISVARGHWNLKHPCFNKIKEFLKSL